MHTIVIPTTRSRAFPLQGDLYVALTDAALVARFGVADERLLVPSFDAPKEGGFLGPLAARDVVIDFSRLDNFIYCDEGVS
jgi:hypothetical protein